MKLNWETIKKLILLKAKFAMTGSYCNYRRLCRIPAIGEVLFQPGGFQYHLLQLWHGDQLPAAKAVCIYIGRNRIQSIHFINSRFSGRYGAEYRHYLRPVSNRIF